jgi:hypothetical protein
MLNNDLPGKLSAELQTTYGCHAAVLYGSRARDDWDAASDIDVIAFRDAGGHERVASQWNGLFLDLFVHATNDEADPSWIRIHAFPGTTCCPITDWHQDALPDTPAADSRTRRHSVRRQWPDRFP